MKLILDAMGGDYAPASCVKGALSALSERRELELVLVGRGEEILEILEKDGKGELPPRLAIAHASEVVEVTDEPTTAFREKKDSSLTVGLNLLHSGEGAAFISAGSTGALLSAATLLIKRIHGVRRAALAPAFPNIKGKTILIDCGANTECTGEYLLQFALMGSFYASRALNVGAPRIGLLNIGVEETKGSGLQQEAYGLLREAHESGHIHFVGNVEANSAFLGVCDVLVTDGYSGNIFLKSMEGTASFLLKSMKSRFRKSFISKMGALLLKGEFRNLLKALDPNEVGGTPLLGISKPVIKAHGSSNEIAIKNAIFQAMDFADSTFLEEMTAHFSKK